MKKQCRERAGSSTRNGSNRVRNGQEDEANIRAVGKAGQAASVAHGCSFCVSVRARPTQRSACSVPCLSLKAVSAALRVRRGPASLFVGAVSCGRAAAGTLSFAWFERWLLLLVLRGSKREEHDDHQQPRTSRIEQHEQSEQQERKVLKQHNKHKHPPFCAILSSAVSVCCWQARFMETSVVAFVPVWLVPRF